MPLLPLLLAIVIFSGEVRARRETRASEEDDRRRAIYLKSPRYNPSAPIRTANSHKDFNSHVNFSENEQVTDTHWHNTALGKSNTNRSGALLPPIMLGYYFVTRQYTHPLGAPIGCTCQNFWDFLKQPDP
jgi:hypothetical protein